MISFYQLKLVDRIINFMVYSYSSVRTKANALNYKPLAGVAELADAQDLKSCGR